MGEFACREWGLHPGGLPGGGVYPWGVCPVGVCLGGALHPGGSAPNRGSASKGGLHSGGVGQTHPNLVIRDMVNGRAVCILPECILVSLSFFEFYGNEASTSVSFVKMNCPKEKVELKSNFNCVLHPHPSVNIKILHRFP